MKKAALLFIALTLTSVAWAWPPRPVPIGEVVFERTDCRDGRGGELVYSNLETSTPPEQYYVPTSTAGAAYGDDLHLTEGGNLAGFSFAYYDPPGGTALTQAVVAFYQNDASDSLFPGGAPSAALIVSYMITDLPGDGAHIVELSPPGVLALPEHVWMEVAFLDSAEAGLVLFNPPTVGASHDLFYVHGVSKFVFGYPYVANFGMAVAIDTQAPCLGDLNHDGLRNLDDLAQMLGHYGMTSGASYEDGDLTGDGAVNLDDLAAMLGVYGVPCP